ncbi:MAG: FAD-dependent oxidoreductase [Anaerolineae bacterium]|nr:FAD-dependent oxidoreductase [Anaerolineae bacterium]
MPDVIIIGAGLSGLAAAAELEGSGLETTLIEVQRRVGGTIRTVQQADFVVDAGAFLLANTFDSALLESLNVEDALISQEDGCVFFRDGTQMLVDALAKHIAVPRLMRMAVSSIGQLEDERFGVCLENGLLLQARAIIIAIPLRYAERLFYGYITEITEQLLSLKTRSLQRVTLGFDQSLPRLLPDETTPFILQTSHPARVPAGHTMLQFGVAADAPVPDMIEQIRQHHDLPKPAMSFLSHASESLTLPVEPALAQQKIQAIRAKLPAKVALIGSDYHFPQPQDGIIDLGSQMQQARRAAQAIRQEIVG